MLSNPTNLQQRQRQHRRQQSTPTAFEATKVPNLPPIQRHASHRRGMSLDQRQRRQSPPQDNKTVSNTNQGFNDNQQQILREAQQQRLARPGQYSQYTEINDENYELVAQLVNSQGQNFDDATVLLKYGIQLHPENSNSYSAYSDSINTTNQANYSDYSQGHIDSGSFTNSRSVIQSQFDITELSSISYDGSSNQQDWGATIKPVGRNSGGRRVSGGIADRVAQYEGMAAENPASRPYTPPNHNASNGFPPSPDITPFNSGLKAEGISHRFSESYDTSMEETIKPGRNRSPRRAQTIFQEMRDHAEHNQPPSPPSSTPLASPAKFDSAPMPISRSTASFMNMQNLKLDFDSHDGLGLEFNKNVYESPDWSPTHSNLTPEMSQESSPNASHASMFVRAFENKPVLDPPGDQYYLPISPDMDLNEQDSPSHQTHRRSESVDSITLEEVITETGITIDDIAQWIAGPDTSDQKWSCLYPECGKRFGRKENIKSHVQTHLGDRQYQCPHCKKCFVRQHDLKRHAKIHSGVKPYPCACGNSFARHDALTRHRQRGMCIGAFEGVVKKIVKRGRPRKPRPDDEERLEKSSKTRSKNRNKIMSSASSASEYSDESGRSPVADEYILDDKPFGDFMTDFSQSGPSQADMENFYSPAASPLPTDCVSPRDIQNAPTPTGASPSAFSTHSHYSHASPSRSQHSHRNSVVSVPDLHAINIPLPASPAKSTVSQYNTPPELCLSSSPPASRHSQFFDPEVNDEDDMDLSKLAQLQMDHDNDDDMFLEAFGSHTEMGGVSGGMSRLEQDLLMGGKFDDEAFGNVVDGDDVFQNCSDLYFGSP